MKHIRHAILLLAWLPVVSTAPCEELWVRPTGEVGGGIRWGHRKGLQVSLPTNGGPFGLLYLYHDAIVGKSGHVLNFIAVEPVVGNRRGLSELEPSNLDRRAGKRFWSANAPAAEPRAPFPPARGVVTSHGSTESLHVYIMVEPFENGARPYLRLVFQSDKPDELMLESFSTSGSARMESCILTATMGNYARLRRLHLADKVVSAGELWPTYKERDFAPAVDFPLNRLSRPRNGGVFVAATPDEPNPAASPAPGHWNFTGIPAAQYWRLSGPEATTGTVTRVNGRYVYWKSRRPIPGGIAFENFELQRPFRWGETSIFGVTTAPLELKL